MAVPKKKTSPQKRGTRRAHDALKPINISVDKDGDSVLPHHMNLKTGMYKGELILEKKKKSQEAESEA